jgi:hypothetical protein
MLVPEAPINTSLLSAGTVLIQENIVLPESLRIETSIIRTNGGLSSPTKQHWRQEYLLLGSISSLSWGSLEGSAFGHLSPMNLNWALRRILRQVQELSWLSVKWRTDALR